METIILILQLAAASLAISWLVIIAVRNLTSPLHLSWAAFCGSMAMVGVSGAFADQLGPFHLIVQAGGAAGCGAAWLVTRAMFRERRAIEWPHIAVVLVIMAPSVFARLMWSFDTSGIIDPARLDSVLESAFAAQTLFSSTILVLTFFEVFRGWAPNLPQSEKRLRIVYGTAFASAVLICTAWANQAEETVRVLTTSSCALTLLLIGSFAIYHRARSPLGARDTQAAAPPVSQLAQRIDRLMRGERLYLEPELKIADVATRLGEPDYKLSKAIADGLGCANFNQYINGFRISHAMNLLGDPAHERDSILMIALESGFASPGPFNRAFKTRTGQTPRAYRLEALAGPSPGNLASAE